jgi:hypothetical protein
MSAYVRSKTSRNLGGGGTPYNGVLGSSRIRFDTLDLRLLIGWSMQCMGSCAPPPIGSGRKSFPAGR